MVSVTLFERAQKMTEYQKGLARAVELVESRLFDLNQEQFYSGLSAQIEELHNVIEDLKAELSK